MHPEANLFKRNYPPNGRFFNPAIYTISTISWEKNVVNENLQFNSILKYTFTPYFQLLTLRFLKKC